MQIDPPIAGEARAFMEKHNGNAIWLKLETIV